MLRRLVLPSPKKKLKKFQIRIQSETHAFLLRASFCLVDYILHIKKKKENESIKNVIIFTFQ